MTNREVIQRWYTVRDTALLADNVDWTVLSKFPAGGNYVGRKAVLDHFFPTLLAHFATYTAEPEKFVCEAETVVVTGRYRATGKTGTVAVSAFAHIWTVRQGQIVAFNQIADTAAIQAAISA